MRKRLIQVDKALGEAERLVPFSLVNPENTSVIKRKFLRRPFNPQFTYPDLPNLDEVQSKIEDLRFAKRFAWGRLFQQEREHIYEKVAMSKAIGTSKFASLCARAYGKPEKKLINKAYELLDLPKAAPAKKIKYDEARDILKKTFKMLGFKYTIRRKEMVTSASISPGSRLLLLRAKERFSKTYMYRLAVHEIATHALRAENGRQYGLGIMLRGTPNYLATEEGLAAYNEERAGVMTTSMLKNYAGRVVAVDLAQRHSFVDTYKQLAKHFSKETAFKLTLRVKRGLNSGEALGACTKDHVYLKGYLAVKDYVSKGGNLDLLHTAKIAISDLDTLKRKLKEPKYIPQPVIEWTRHELLKT